MYLQLEPGRARQLQRVGSALILASPLFALGGFVHDPPAGLGQAWLGGYAGFVMFGGIVLHAAAGWARRKRA